MCQRLSSLAAAGFIVTFLHVTPSTAQTAISPGTVIEDVAAGSLAQKAGLRRGDVVNEWARSPDSERVSLSDPIALIRIELEEASKGPVHLYGRRNETRLSWLIAGTPWRLTTRPVFQADLLTSYEASASALRAGDAAGAGATLEELAGRPALAAGTRSWLWTRAARAYALARSREKADAAAAQAIAIADSTTSDAGILTRRELAIAFEERGDFPRTAALLNDAIERSPAETLMTAQLLHDRGRTSLRRGAFVEGLEFTTKALAIRERLVPDSLVVANSLTNAATALGQRGDAAAAEHMLQRALKIYETRGSEVEAASSLTNLGSVALVRRDFNAADRYFRRALEIQRAIDPNGAGIGNSLGSLAKIAEVRGHLATADDLIDQAITILEKHLPRTFRELAVALGTAASVAEKRRLFPAAAHYYRKELSIFEKIGADREQTARVQLNLSKVLAYLGEHADADALLNQAVEVLEKSLAPDAADRSVLYSTRASIALLREDYETAEQNLRRALSIEEKARPATLDAAKRYGLLSMTLRSRNRGPEAVKAAMQALEVVQRAAPGSAMESVLLHELGAANRSASDLAAAEGYFVRAIETFENQNGTFGHTEEVRAQFNAGYSDYYTDLIEVLVTLKRHAEAFNVLERSRARSLLEKIAERDIAPPSEMPEELRKQIAAADLEYVQVARELEALSGTETVKVQAALARTLELRRKQEQLAKQARASAPRFADIKYPSPDTVDRVQAVLDPGTLLLTYAVGEKVTTLFALTRASALTVHTLPIGTGELARRVGAFRDAIERRPPTERGLRSSSTTGQDYEPLAAALFDVLIRPVSALVAESNRIAISPDGALHNLPFAALLDKPRKGPARYLIESKPLHIVGSATLFHSLQNQRRQQPWPPPTVTAFGDPVFAETTGTSGVAVGPVNPTRTATALTPLPGTRHEVEELAKIYPDAAIYLGRDATELRAKSIAGAVRYLHFGTHGILNPLVPLNSGIALTRGGSGNDPADDGVLQAWEIYDRMRFDADLVTLSACDTAQGQELGGEGLASLARAFLYAGARSVLGSQWKVDDAATGQFMNAFYRHLKNGASKDDALRQAQLAFLKRSPKDSSTNRLPWSAPYYWAAFSLMGDWK